MKVKCNKAWSYPSCSYCPHVSAHDPMVQNQHANKTTYCTSWGECIIYDDDEEEINLKVRCVKCKK